MRIKLCKECGGNLSSNNATGLCGRCYKSTRLAIKNERKLLVKPRESDAMVVRISCKCGCSDGFSSKDGGPRITSCTKCHSVIQEYL
jgi:hypothetical protein